MKKTEYPLIVLSSDVWPEIVFVEFPQSTQIDLATAMHIVACRLDFTENNPHYLIGDVSNIKSVTAEAKAFLQKADGGLKNILGAGLIASNPVSALIANIFIKKSSHFPSRFFSNKRDADVWITSLRQNAVDKVNKLRATLK